MTSLSTVRIESGEPGGEAQDSERKRRRLLAMNIGIPSIPASPVSQTGSSLMPAPQLDISRYARVRRRRAALAGPPVTPSHGAARRRPGPSRARDRPGRGPPTGGPSSWPGLARRSPCQCHSDAGSPSPGDGHGHSKVSDGLPITDITFNGISNASEQRRLRLFL
jgi:hypothetical protein